MRSKSKPGGGREKSHREMSVRKNFHLIRVAATLSLTALSAYAQRSRGELHIEVRDPQGTALAAASELISDADPLRQTFPAATHGRNALQDLSLALSPLSLTARDTPPS